MTITTTRQTAPEILQDFVQSAPVDLNAMASAMGLAVVFDPNMGEDSGKIERCGTAPAGYRITINAKHASTRQRFTLAHEIAHYILHRDLIGDGIIDDALYRSARGDHIERQANAYAAAILMPAVLVRQRFHAGARSFAAIAQIFDVSYQVAEIRLKELRLG